MRCKMTTLCRCALKLRTNTTVLNPLSRVVRVIFQQWVLRDPQLVRVWFYGVATPLGNLAPTVYMWGNGKKR